MDDGAALAEALSPVFSAERVRASPHSLYLAVSSSYRLTVLDAKTLRMLHLFSCMDAIEHIEWSCDSKFIVCGIFARGCAGLGHREARGRHRDEGPVGLGHVRSPPMAATFSRLPTSTCGSPCGRSWTDRCTTSGSRNSEGGAASAPTAGPRLSDPSDVLAPTPHHPSSAPRRA